MFMVILYVLVGLVRVIDQLKLNFETQNPKFKIVRTRYLRVVR